VFGAYLTAFGSDTKVQAVLVLIVLDLLLGVAAAFRLGTFRLSYIADFMRNDVLGKVFPWFLLYAAGLAGPSTDVLGLSLSDIADGVFVAVAAALVGSLLGSVNDFFPNLTVPKALGGREKT
jgi:hypothetical protein